MSNPYMVTDTTGDQEIDGPITVNLDNEEINDGNYSLAGDEITFVAAGTYFISYSLSYEIKDTAGDTRGAAHAWVDDDDGGAYATSPGSHSYDYHRETASTPGSCCSCGFLLYLANAGKKIRLRAEQASFATNIDTIANGSSLSIIKVA